MYVVGSDRISMRANGIGPAAPAHAVDRDGDVLCRDERPRYHFPWLDWMGETAPDETRPDEARAAACPDCATIALERALPAAAGDDPYPSATAPAAAADEPHPPATASGAVQPAIDWLRFPQDFSVWSDGL